MYECRMTHAVSGHGNEYADRRSGMHRTGAYPKACRSKYGSGHSERGCHLCGPAGIMPLIPGMEESGMLLTIFLAIILCAAVTLMLVAAVAFVQKKALFSSAPKEAQALIKPRERELFDGARIMGWMMLILSIGMILGAVIISIWDGFRSGFGFWQFFTRFVLILTIYKVYDMVFFDWFILCRFHFFQHYYPEAESALVNRKYGFNLKSQLLKLLVIFPAVSALAAWICTLF